ncbi:MAG: glycoside hydrolase family 3 C-terminal domain-containing protein [Agathobacter sp.]|nr:glycoside hydrolase family 3 C-terminal domain-containing protein [Agathobacter sp.]
MKRNIKEIIGQMTLEEKAGMCSGKDYWNLKGVERLGIPSVKVSDGPNGLRTPTIDSEQLGFNSMEAISYPSACLSACSFDTELMEEMGERIGEECRSRNIAVILGPSANMKRSPLCGRNFEYFSEDPYLGAHIAAAYVKGVQSKDVSACVKHFTANNQEYRRQTCSSEADERTLREIYLNAFEDVVKEGKPDIMMASYNKVNGTYMTENKKILTDILRDEWGFDGYVMSDWSAVSDRVKALKAGLDLAMPGEGLYMDQEIVKAVQDGMITEEELDKAVERILKIIFKFTDSDKKGTFDKEYDHNISKKVAEESMVLLKNDGILPLPEKGKKIAFIGAFAKTPRFQGGGSSNVNPYKVISALDAAKSITEISYAQGFELTGEKRNDELFDAALKTAAEADVVVIFAGLPETFESEGFDRTHMRMPECQNELISEIAKVQKNVVVVLHNGAPVEMLWTDEVKGILEAYLGGEAVGQAVVELLFGRKNPCGKLAETIPYKLEDTPSYLYFPGNGKKVEYREGVFVGYRYYDTKKMQVRFPFGHGLSYTRFEYSNLQVSKENMTDNETLQVSFKVKNVGNMAGKEIVQLYVSDKTHLAERPVKELKGFKKVMLKPGEEATIVMELNKRSFAWYSTELGGWYAVTGNYEIVVGASSDDIRLTKEIHVDSTDVIPLKVDRNTTISELLENPKTNAVIMSLLNNMVQYLNSMQEESEGENAKTVQADQLIKMLESSPLRFMNSLLGMSQEQIEELIGQLQYVLDM